MFSATPSFLLKMIFGYALFGYARFSFEVDFRLCSFRLCPLFFEVIFRLCLLFGYAHFSFEVVFGYAFFGYARNCFLYLCFHFPPLYANRSNAIGGEGRFFYVFTACVPSFRQLYFLSVHRS
jgi:hypothetical protein